MYGTLAQARRKARGIPELGEFVAEVAVPSGSVARVERTLGPGHYTVWAEPLDLLRWVASVLPVETASVE